MNKFTYFFIFLIILVIYPASKVQSDSTNNHPFFLMGDGVLKIKNSHNGRESKVNLFDAEHNLNEKAFDQIDEVFGYPTKERGEHISERMIFMLDYFSDQFAPGKTIHITSGYRSPQYNQSLRDQGRIAAKTSTHIDGMAIDFYIDGVDGKAMWEAIRAKDCCGAGHYGGKNVHLDSGRPRFWQAATSKVDTGASDFNRYIYLSTEYDRYKPGDKLRLLYTSISDFGFGINPQIYYLRDGDSKGKAIKSKILTDNKTDCLMINKRKDARFIYSDVPQKLKPGRYKIQVNFCNRPFKEMPTDRISNVIEIIQ